MFNFLKIFKPKVPTKCLLVGDSGTGKTTFMNLHLTGIYDKQHIPTIGVAVYPIEFHTDRGSVNFEIWDTAGVEELGGLRNGYYFFSHCAIIMFDVGNYESCKNVCKWRQDIKNICGNDIPIVVCGNKIDLEFKERKVPTGSLRFQSRENFEYFLISTRANYNIDLPFKWLCGKILKNDKAKLIAQPIMNPPEIEITQHEQLEITNELKAVKEQRIGKDECNCSFSDHADCSGALNFTFSLSLIHKVNEIDKID